MKKLFLIISTLALKLTIISGTNAEQIPGNKDNSDYHRPELVHRIYKQCPESEF